MNKTVARRAGASTLRVLAFLALALLVIEYIFGMLVNLFVAVPNPLPGTASGGMLQALGWSLTQAGMPSLVLHAALGLALVLVALAILVLSILRRQTQWITASGISAVGIILATLSGIGFIAHGDAGASMTMSVGFILSLVSYSWVLYGTR